MKVRIKRVDADLPLPIYQTKGAVGFDLHCRESKEIAPGEIGLIPANVVVEIPAGYMVLMAARSSTGRKKNLMLVNGVGIVDNDFCGDDDELNIQMWNFGKEAVTVERGERIAQGILVKVDVAEWEEVEKMTAENRGGIGSTG